MKILIGNSIAGSLRSSLEETAAVNDRAEASIGRFASTEAFAEILSNVKDEPTIVIQSIAAANGQTANDHAMQMLLAIRTLKRYGAGPIWAITPFAGYARQDKTRVGHQDSVAADDFAAMLKEAGAVGVSTVEIHSNKALKFLQNQFGEKNVYNIDPIEFLSSAVIQDNNTNTVVGGPDGSADARAQKFAGYLGATTFQTAKHRSEVQVSESELTAFNGQVAGKKVIEVDDMIDTGGTVIHCAERATVEGATTIDVVTPHFVGSKNAMERLLTARKANDDRLIGQLIIADTIDNSAEIDRLERQYPGTRKRISVMYVGSLLNRHIQEFIKPHPSMQPQPK